MYMNNPNAIAATATIIKITVTVLIAVTQSSLGGDNSAETTEQVQGHRCAVENFGL
jgi:hypothetical protein